MGQPYFITAYPRPFPEGQAFLMTRDLSHEEERKSEWEKSACRERQKETEQEWKARKEEKNEEGEEKVSGTWEG